MARRARQADSPYPGRKTGGARENGGWTRARIKQPGYRGAQGIEADDRKPRADAAENARDRYSLQRGGEGEDARLAMINNRAVGLPPKDPLELSDREEELLDWLEANNVPRSDEIFPVLLKRELRRRN